ncbi:hypothetical protein BDF21DRAFT_430256, partial [Thamnidium elegans]
MSIIIHLQQNNPTRNFAAAMITHLQSQYKKLYLLLHPSSLLSQHRLSKNKKVNTNTHFVYRKKKKKLFLFLFFFFFLFLGLLGRSAFQLCPFFFSFFFLFLLY